MNGSRRNVMIRKNDAEAKEEQSGPARGAFPRLLRTALSGTDEGRSLIRAGRGEGTSGEPGRD